MRIVLGLEGRRSQWDLGIDYSYCLYMQNNSRPLSDMQLFYSWRPGPVALTSSSLPTSLSFSCLGWIQAYERFSSENSFWVTWKQGSHQQATARVCEPAHLRRLVPRGCLRPRPDTPPLPLFSVTCWKLAWCWHSQHMLVGRLLLQSWPAGEPGMRSGSVQAQGPRGQASLGPLSTRQWPGLPESSTSQEDILTGRTLTLFQSFLWQQFYFLKLFVLGWRPVKWPLYE